MARVYFAAIFTASIFLTINSLVVGLVGAIGPNTTLDNSTSTEPTNIQMTNYDKVTVGTTIS